MKLSDIFKKKAVISKTEPLVVKIDKKKLKQLTGGITYEVDPRKFSDASAGQGAKD